MDSTPIFNSHTNIYIDPDNISGPSRKKLIKRLEALGASITTDPKYARFILVKAGTPSAEQLAEVWDDKVILSSSWVDACVQAGQLLVEDDQWSRYTAANIVHEVPQTQIKTEPDVPLLTPRPTPISPHRSHVSASTLSNHLPLFIPSDIQPSMDDMVQFVSQLPVDVLREAIELQQRVVSATMDSLDYRGLVPGSLSAAVPQQPKPTKRHSSSPSEEHIRKRPKQLLFTSSSGEPYGFYVQIGHQNRHDLVKTIEKYGGRISSNILKADFAILSKTSKDFAALRRERQGTEKPAILSSFVYDSVQQGVLLEVSDYQLEEISMKQKSPPKTVRKSSNIQPKKQTGKRSTPCHSDPQGSPSPPPQSARGEKYAKGYAYPEMERQFVSTYLSFLFERDHLLSNMEIAQRLYKKMPHHSTRAWRVYLAKEFKDTLTNLRAQYSLKDNVDSDFQDDVEVITDYFAYEDDDPDESDSDKRFAGLSRKAMPRTASSWREFLSTHQVIVQKRFEEKVAANL